LFLHLSLPWQVIVMIAVIILDKAEFHIQNPYETSISNADSQPHSGPRQKFSLTASSSPAATNIHPCPAQRQTRPLE